MTKAEYIENLISVNKMIAEDFLKNPSFGIEDLERVQSKMTDLINQLEFWAEKDNKDRFLYELKNYINWVIKNYS